MSKPAQNVTDATLQEVVTDAVRRRVGKGADKVSVCYAATCVGYSDGFWQQVRAGSKTPSLLATGNLAVALGPEAGAALLSEILASFGFTGVRPIEATEACPHKVTGDLASAIRLIAEALEDGEFDDRERFEVASRLRALSSKADGISPVRRVA